MPHNAFGDELDLRLVERVRHLDQFQAIADCPYRANQVMTDAGAYQGREIGCIRFQKSPPERNIMADLNAILAPGMLVRHPDRPDWGVGQVQSNVAGRITVNFPDEGKVVFDASRITLLPVFDAT